MAAQYIHLVQKECRFLLEETSAPFQVIPSPLWQAIELNPVALEHCLKLSIRQVTLQKKKKTVMVIITDTHKLHSLPDVDKSIQTTYRRRKCEFKVLPG